MRNILLAIGTFLGSLVVAFFLLPAVTFGALNNPFLPYQGGTGTSTAPTYGQVLVGNSGGTYTLTATSSLGISGGSGGSGNVSTSSSETAGYLSYWTSTAATPALLGKIATSTLTPTSPLTGSFVQIGSSGSLGLDTTGTWSGNAGTATKLQTARTINGVSFDGTSNITINAASSTLLSDNNTFTGRNMFKLLNLTATSSALLGTDSSGNVVATSSIGTNLLTGTLGTINGTTLSAGGSITINAASSTLLGDANTWSKLQLFSNATSSLFTATNGFWGASLSSCSGASNALTWSAGLFGCNTISSGSGTVGTSTVPTVGQLAYWTSNGYPSLLGSVATTTLVAGSGISFSSTPVILGSSPITVSATGGSVGTLSVETPSGTINGSNTVFTTTNNPAFVVLNGSTQSGSGVDYTLSGSGPYTLTFVNAPLTGSVLRSYYGNAAGLAPWAFTPTTNYGVAVQSTSTPIWDTAGLMASSTSYFDNSTSSLATFGTAWIPSLGTSAGAFLAVDNNGKVIATTTPSGGGGSPGGSNTQVQYNSSGAFAGSSNLTFNGTTLTVAKDMTVNNVTVGEGAGSQLGNTILGGVALSNNSTGSYNTAIGYGALQHQTGSYNEALGVTAGNGAGADSSTGNLFLGYEAGLSNQSSGNYNILAGYEGGYNLTTGSNNIVLGSYVNAPSNTGTGQLNIGNLLYGTGIYSTASLSSSPVSGGTFGIATTTFNGIFGVGTDSSSASTTISAGKIQWDGYNTAGSRVCAFIVGTTLTITSGACTP